MKSLQTACVHRAVFRALFFGVYDVKIKTKFAKHSQLAFRGKRIDGSGRK